MNLDTDLTVLRVRPPDGGFERGVEKRPSGRRRRRGVHARACAASRGGGRRPTEWNGGGGGVRACVRARVPNERTNDRPTDRTNERFVLAGPGAPGRPERERTATWLILPVVICLSQRLSHACLSTYHVLVCIKPCMSKYISCVGLYTKHGYLSYIN